jgi:hypothetical protein
MNAIYSLTSHHMWCTCIVTGPVSVLVSTRAQFDPEHTTRFDDPAAIGKAVLEAQNSLVGDQPVMDKPVQVRYTRPSGPVMTLMDLPGITHTDEQNPGFDIHGATTAMVAKYISSENMIVLVVIPANDDFGNAEAIKMVKNADAEERCIGVVTKCDLLPTAEGSTDIIEKIRMERGSDVKLDHGFIAVCNRAPNQTEKTADEMEVVEQQLFQTHPFLRELKTNEWGFSTLTSKIVELQSGMIDKWIPSVKKEIRLKRLNFVDLLDKLGVAPSTQSERRTILSRIISAVDRRLNNLVTAQTTSIKTINIAARTHEIALRFSEAVQSELPSFLSTDYGDGLKAGIDETLGHGMSNFLSHPIFKNEIDKHFFANGNLADATEQMIETTFDLMMRAVAQLLDAVPECNTWNNLTPVLLEAWTDHLSAAKAALRKHAKTTILAESAQVFTLNSYYVETLSKVKTKVQELRISKAEGQAVIAAKARNTEKLEHEIGVDATFINAWTGRAEESEQARMELQLSLHCYAETITNRLFDVLPIVVRQLLVFEPHRMFAEVMHQACTDEVLDRTVSESAAAAKKRSNYIRSIARFDQALKKLNAFH